MSNQKETIGRSFRYVVIKSPVRLCSGQLLLYVSHATHEVLKLIVIDKVP
jgi:hypothetical protein